jgi:hypothetical protein
MVESGCAAVFLLMLSLSQLAPAIADDDVNANVKDAILRAWGERQERLASCRITWTERMTIRAGSLNRLLSEFRESKSGENPPLLVPAKELEFKYGGSFAMKESLAKYTAAIIQLQPDMTVKLAQHASSFDGETSRMLSRPEGDVPQGTFRAESKNADVPSVPLMPLLLNLRPLSRSRSGLEMTEMAVVQTGVELAGAKCIVIQDSMQRLWLDVARGFIVLRWEQVQQATGHVVTSCDITYELQGEFGWLPNAWTTQSFSSSVSSDHAPDQVITATVDSFQPAAKLATEDFRLEFPVGTRVYDQRSKKDYIVGANEPQELDSGLPPSAGASRLSFARTVAIAATFVVLLIVVCCVLWNARRGRTSVQSGNSRGDKLDS